MPDKFPPVVNVQGLVREFILLSKSNNLNLIGAVPLASRVRMCTEIRDGSMIVEQIGSIAMLLNPTVGGDGWGQEAMFVLVPERVVLQAEEMLPDGIEKAGIKFLHDLMPKKQEES